MHSAVRRPFRSVPAGHAQLDGPEGPSYGDSWGIGSRFVRGCSLLTVVACLCLSGCNTAREVWYFGEETDGYYRTHATQIDFPNVSQPLPEAVVTTEAPRTIQSREQWEARDITLLEAMQIALQNNEIFRSAGTFQSIGGGVLAGGDRVSSVYDPAIQESGALTAQPCQSETGWGCDEDPHCR